LKQTAMVEVMRDEWDSAQAEIERLRAALKECAGIARGKLEHDLADRIQAVLDKH
jgi:hypothetical protein